SATLDAINKWASDNTNGKIPKVLDDLSPDLVLILMNALYFKGEWSKQFTESATANQTFYQSESVQFPTKFMNSDIAVTTAEVNGLQVIEIPYGRKNFSMLLVVPILSLQQQYEKLTPETWLGLTSILNEQTWDSATVLLPKFTFSYETYFNQALQSMGMLDAFDSYYANFDGISDAEKLFISFVKQNTFIEVNEEGTEAAAVTTIGFSRTSVDDPPRKPIYTFNKPFVFAIRERSSNTLLFIGSLSDPRE
ncbi:MAG: serpin family protein, partial [Bacteroidetes bacterium]|nr:serpin family protein [Bacteroidota bacterium]